MQGLALRLSRLVIATLAGASVSGCAWFASDDRNDPVPLTAIVSTTGASVAWRASVGSGSGYGFAPAIIGDAVYAASANGNVARLDLATGATVWNKNVARVLSAGVGSDGQTVAVVTPQGEVIALNANGEEKWRTRASSEVSIPPWVGNGVVVVRAGDYRIQAFNAENGDRIWNVQRPGPALALRAPARMTMTENLIIVGMPGGRVLAVEPATGAVIWEGVVAAASGASDLERVNDVVGIPVVRDQKLCAVAYQGRVTCFDIDKGGQVAWARNFSSIVGLAVDARHVYAPDARDNVSALSMTDGQPVWRQDGLRNRQVTEPAATGRAVVLGDYQGFVHVLSPDTGEFMARVAMGGGEMRAPVQQTPQGVLVQAGDSSVALIRLD
jgi:outer membrane protein assembly factor BamB